VAGRQAQRGRVAVRADLRDGTPLRIAFSIADNGIGIAPETLAVLFTSFTQAEVSTTRRFGGSGLGLAITKRLVDMMAGEIVVESTPGTGSTFTVTMPFDAAQERSAELRVALSGLNCIVLANGESPVADLRAYLEYAGARVMLASDPNSAVALASGLSLPIVIYCVGEHEAAHSIAMLQSAFAAVPGARFVLITQDERQRSLLEDNNAVTMQGNPLRCQTLLRSVAVAAGRASPNVFCKEAIENDIDTKLKLPPVSENRAQGRSVLVAEDDTINQKVITRQLGLLGHRVEIAVNDVEALRLWRGGSYALLLTDLHMPEMDGYALVETIRREEAELGARPRMPILALTANALIGESRRALAIGMDAYLTKPLQLNLLRAALEKWLPSEPLKTTQDVSGPKHSSGLPVFDVAVLQNVVGVEAGIVREFLVGYLDSARRQANALRLAHAAGDAHVISATAHKLKSSSRTVGALALGELCQLLEQAAQGQQAASISQAMGRLDAVLAAAEAEIMLLTG